VSEEGDRPPAIADKSDANSIQLIRILEISYLAWTALLCACLLGGVVELLLGQFVFGQVANLVARGLGIFTIITSVIGIPLSIRAIFCYRNLRHYRFCFGAAIFMCITNFPLGMLISIFSLVVLTRDSTRMLFR
jgi:mannose/fructose/N-acetylgalactosamine-specific phosphotransferase system component IIC